jgi:hypothetical protein
MNEKSHMRWGFQEWYVRWTVWAIGWHYADHRGWSPDELTIFFGPLRFDFLRWEVA